VLLVLPALLLIGFLLWPEGLIAALVGLIWGFWWLVLKTLEIFVVGISRGWRWLSGRPQNAQAIKTTSDPNRGRPSRD
jgi:hypothetical protein